MRNHGWERGPWLAGIWALGACLGGCGGNDPVDPEGPQSGVLDSGAGTSIDGNRSEGTSDAVSSGSDRVSSDAPAIEMSPGDPGREAGADALAQTMMCSNDTCESLSVQGLVMLPACCVNHGGCGRDISTLAQFLAAAIPPEQQCQPQNQPGVPDDSCPKLQIGPVPLGPCCKPNGHCGFLTKNVLGNDLGFGCVDPTDLGQSSDGGNARCTYAGSSDAGIEARAAD